MMAHLSAHCTAVIIAVNRYVAIAQPNKASVEHFVSLTYISPYLQYKQMFTKRIALIIIAALWMTILGNTTPYLWNHCDFYMDPYWLGWTFEPSLCGRALTVVK